MDRAVPVPGPGEWNRDREGIPGCRIVLLNVIASDEP